MSEERIHRAVSNDGTRLAGHIHGEGPPLVLVHGGLGSGGGWGRLLPYLTDRFTCYPMSTRGRGLSGETTDYSAERHVEDVASYVESIGEPVGLIGFSSGGALALAAAARSDAVAALAAHEPAFLPLAQEDLVSRLRSLGPRMAEAVEGGRSIDAAGIFIEFIANEEEFALLSHPDFLEAWKQWGRAVPHFLRQLQQMTQSVAPDLTSDPRVLEEISVPVLLVHGSRSQQSEWFDECLRHVAEHVPQTRIRELEGAGHLAPYLESEAFAAELVSFFQPEMTAA